MALCGVGRQQPHSRRVVLTSTQLFSTFIGTLVWLM